MSVWAKQLGGVWPFDKSLTWQYTPRAPTMYVCTDHRMVTPIPSNDTAQKSTTIQILNRRDVTFNLVQVRQSTIKTCFVNEPQRSGWAKASHPKWVPPSDGWLDVKANKKTQFILSDQCTDRRDLFSRWPGNSRAHRETMKKVRILFARPQQLKQCNFIVFFSYLVTVAWGLNPAHHCDPDMDNILSMSVHKEYNSLWLTLVVLFWSKATVLV